LSRIASCGDNNMVHKTARVPHAGIAWNAALTPPEHSA
jgi:hypothetical protein